jgi:hypothetical protein
MPGAAGNTGTVPEHPSFGDLTNTFPDLVVAVDECAEAEGWVLGAETACHHGCFSGSAQHPGRERRMALSPIIGVVLNLLGGYYCGGMFGAAQRDPALRPFARKLGHLASRFESEQVLALIAHYLQPE